MPFALGYRMPAEWEKHEATWLAWPKNPRTFPHSLMEDVEQIYVKIIEELVLGERVDLLVDDEDTEDRVSSMLKRNHQIVFHRIKMSDVWVRDYSPIFVKNANGIAVTKWIFNAWGNKYEDLKSDNETGIKIARLTGMRIFEPGMVLEGGSIDVNGLGTCITTKQCLLNRNRNPELNQHGISKLLNAYLGLTNLIWLESGIAGDDTDGHVDDVARFINEDTVLCMIEDDSKDENCATLRRNLEVLCEATDQRGNKINVVPIKMPRRVDCEDGRLPASYANFYIGNVVVLVPIYGDSNDSAALNALQTFFPERKVVGINCSPLVYGFGAIHCVTQQQPSS
jgi:agmatine deiminase